MYVVTEGVRTRTYDKNVKSELECGLWPFLDLCDDLHTSNKTWDTPFINFRNYLYVNFL